MIYLGNLPVCPASQLMGDGYKFKRVQAADAFSVATDLKAFILANLGPNADAFGINASVFGDYDELVNQYVYGFYVQIREGDFTPQSGYIRKNSGQNPQFTVGWSSSTGAKSTAGDEFLIVYKEVA